MIAHSRTIPFRRLTGAVLLTLSVTICRAGPSPRADSLSASLRMALHRYRVNDDLTGWIYEQIQWARKEPSDRRSCLAKAVGEAWRQPHNEAEIQAWQDLLTNEGYLFLLSGDIVASTDAYTAAYDWAREHQELADDALVLATILKPLGNNYTRLGDYEQALFIQRKALGLAMSAGDRQALAGAYSNLANTCSNMGLSSEALNYCREGLAVADPRSALYGLLLSEQADAFEQSEQPRAAKASIDKSIRILERTRSDDAEPVYWLLMAYQQAGDIYSDAPAKALGFYDRALVLQDRLLLQHKDIRQRERAKLFQRLGALFMRLHDQARADHWTDRCLAVLVPGKPLASLRAQDLYAENTLSDVLYTKAVLAEQAGATDEALRLYTLCFATEGKLRDQYITGSSKERAIAGERQRFEKAIATAWAAWVNTRQMKYQRSMLQFMESSKSQLLLEEAIQQQPSIAGYRNDSLRMRVRLLEKALIYYEKADLGKSDSLSNGNAAREEQLSWELARLRRRIAASRPEIPIGEEQAGTSRSPIWLNSLTTVAQPGQAIRSYFAGAAALYTVECTSTGISYADKLELPASWQDILRDFTDTWFAGGAEQMIDHPSTYCREAFEWYRTLFGSHPFRPDVKYILLPDGVMDLLPVEALVTGTDCPASPSAWPFVIRHTSISYGWSLEMLLQHRTVGIKAGGFSGFFVSGNGRSLPLLNAVAEERSGIKQLVKDGRWFADSTATTANFREALSTSSVVHISSHAFATRDSAGAPHIELYDAPYYLFELKALPHAPELVVLSACRTGDGRMVTGEGVQSLARAFIGGGAGAVVAGWWNVNDAAAAQLMKGFYSGLTTTSASGSRRIDASAALRQAKLEWLDDPSVSYLHKLPYYWGALNYQGDPEPLATGLNDGIPNGWNIPRWWWMLLVVPVGLIILAYVRGRRAYTPA